MFRVMFAVLFCCCTPVFSQGHEYITQVNVPYYSQADRDADGYIKERCVLDVYYPAGKTNIATVVWFHGGGLTGGQKDIPRELRDKGVCVVAANYRLSPRVKASECIEDAAAAVAWVFNHIEQYGGSRSKIFVSGHSAGGYLAAMVGMDKHWLGAHNIDADDIAGLIPFSGHMITHFTVRAERGIEGTQPIIDELAPLYFVRPDAPPLLLITGDREIEMLGRYEENAYMMRMMKVAGHKDTAIRELKGCDHGGMVAPAFPLLLDEVRRVLKKQDSTL